MKPYNCSECGETNPSAFEAHYKGKCKSCRDKTRRQNPRYQKRHAEYYKKWYKEHGRNRSSDYKDIIILWQRNHKKQVNVRIEVTKAIKQGLLERPIECTVCGRKQCRINAHHNDYEYPFDIIWVCSSCHKKLHLQMPLDKSQELVYDI